MHASLLHVVWPLPLLSGGGSGSRSSARLIAWRGTSREVDATWVVQEPEAVRLRARPAARRLAPTACPPRHFSTQRAWARSSQRTWSISLSSLTSLSADTEYIVPTLLRSTLPRPTLPRERRKP